MLLARTCLPGPERRAGDPSSSLGATLPAPATRFHERPISARRASCEEASSWAVPSSCSASRPVCMERRDLCLVTRLSEAMMLGETAGPPGLLAMELALALTRGVGLTRTAGE